jgi:hypothetical protein
MGTIEKGYESDANTGFLSYSIAFGKFNVYFDYFLIEMNQICGNGSKGICL